MNWSVFLPAGPAGGNGDRPCFLLKVAARQAEKYSRPPTRRRDEATAQKQNNPGVAPAPEPETGGSAAVSPEGGGSATAPGDEEGQQAGNSSSSGSPELTRFSDEALERELRRRRRGGGGVGVGAGVGAEGAACGQDGGGVCVPCFEIA